MAAHHPFGRSANEPVRSLDGRAAPLVEEDPRDTQECAISFIEETTLRYRAGWPRDSERAESYTIDAIKSTPVRTRGRR